MPTGGNPQDGLPLETTALHRPKATAHPVNGPAPQLPESRSLNDANGVEDLLDAAADLPINYAIDTTQWPDD